MNETHRGSCHCGAVRYRVNGGLRPVSYCHCGQCRKQSGHYYAATQCQTSDLEVEGEPNLTWYSASDTARRAFCKTCGSALFWRANGSDRTSILAGSLDGPTGLAGENHIFVADKGDYYSIDDGLPQYQQYDR